MKSKLFIVFLFSLVLCSIGCVVATDLNNDTQNIGEIQISDNDDILDSSPSSIQDLKNQISNAEENSVINLTNDYVTTSSCSIDISKSLTIDGQGHTIDCNGNDQYLFRSKNGEITLKNLIIKNSKNTNSLVGGVIFILTSSFF